jgi:hypothetical protein
MHNLHRDVIFNKITFDDFKKFEFDDITDNKLFFISWDDENNNPDTIRNILKPIFKDCWTDEHESRVYDIVKYRVFFVYGTSLFVCKKASEVLFYLRCGTDYNESIRKIYYVEN